jgi:hypothetical protein
MSMKKNLKPAAFALLALSVAGVAYWALRENSQLGAPSGSAGAPPQATAPPAPPASQSASAPPQSQSTAPSAAPAPSAPLQSQATAPSAPAPARSPAVLAQPNHPAASSSPAAFPSENAESSVPAPATPPAPRTTLPPENQMSEADRRQIQQMLQGMKFYQGPIDGKFGPLTRAAIRRYQDSVGAKSTGYLSAEEATRLASTH